MHNSVIVRCGQALGQLDAKLYNFFLRQVSAKDLRVERGAGNVLSDQKVEFLPFAAKLGDRGYTTGKFTRAERCSAPRRCRETLARRRVGEPALHEDLDGHVAIQLLIARAIHHPHLPQRRSARGCGSAKCSCRSCRGDHAGPIMLGTDSERILRGGEGKVNEWRKGATRVGAISQPSVPEIQKPGKSSTELDTPTPAIFDGRWGRNYLLLCRDRIEYTGRLFIEKGSLFRIASAPMFPSARNSQETAWPHALLTGFVPNNA